MTVIDMTGIETTQKVVDDGVYEAVFAKYEMGKSAAGNQKVVMKYKITEEGDAEDTVLSTHRALTKDALWSLKADLLTLGSDPDDIATKFEVEEECEKLIGNTCRISVVATVFTDQKTGEERPGNNITKVSALY